VSRRDDERVADILDAASEIGEVIGLGRDAWDKDRIRQLAVERLLEVPKAEGEGKALRDLYSSRARKADGFTARSSCPSHPPLTSAYAFRGVFSGFRRPLCVRACRGRKARNPRTGTDGGGGSGVLTVRRSGLLTVLLGVWLLTWHFRLPTRCRRLLHRRGRALPRGCRGRR
jgi:hypothetical protein